MFDKKMKKTTKTYLTRETLLKRMQSLNNEESWDEFVFYYGKFIYSIINRMGIYTGEEEDLAQEILLKIWKAIPNFDINQKKGQFRSWLYSVVKNTVLTYLSRSRYKSEKMALFGVELAQQKNHPEIDQLIIEEWEMYISEKAFEIVKRNLSEQALDAFQSALLGEPVEQIAERLSLEVNTVYVYKNRVKNRLVAEIRNLRELLE